MTVTLSPPHCSLSDLCDRRSCCVTANQLMTKFVCVSCATLPWAAAVLSMGVNVPRIFVNVPNCTDFATTAGIVGSQRAAGRWFSDAPHRFPLQTQPRPGKEPTTTIITFTWHASTQLLVHCCLSVDMMLRHRLGLDDQN